MAIKEPYITAPREPKLAEMFPVLYRWIQRVTELLNQISDGIDVNVQDQTTEIIDLHVSQYIDDLAITVDTALDDRTIRVSCATTPTTAHSVCLKEETAFYQGDIITVTPIGGNIYDLLLDSPLDYPYTTAGGCSLRNINLAVDGSSTPVIFTVSPARLNTDVKWDVVRVMFSFIGPGISPSFLQPDDTFFGTQDAVTNGIVVRKVDGVYKNIWNAKSNADLKAHMYDVVYTDKNRSSEYGVNCRRTFGGQGKNGVVVRLENDIDPSKADQFQVVVQDDLTAHTFIQAVVQGHVVDP